MLRVLLLPKEDPRLWQRSLLPQELADLRDRLAQCLAAPELGEVRAPSELLSALDAAGHGGLCVRRRLGEEPCPVCFDPVGARAEAAYCARCGRNVHRGCLAQWWAADAAQGAVGAAPSGSSSAGPPAPEGPGSRGRCPACRAAWAEGAGGRAPGQNLPRGVNLAEHSEAHRTMRGVPALPPDRVLPALPGGPMWHKRESVTSETR
ncbi:unnamed protein product [Prorocentrum cordatum]|uniref:RING-type domain-containing protein n=1 Tax=Prorocentrum cordatum TaxID=2364126 RepID=A0ABN9R826_9DINO|nr:unnamed protein product [Polarella glacialis]